MFKEKLSYDLAIIYTQEKFRDYLSELSDLQKLDYDALIHHIYCDFEDAYLVLQLMDNAKFDFSDVENLSFN